MAAVWIDGPASRPLAGALAALVAVTGLLALTRRGYRSILAFLPFALVLLWWQGLEPRQDRDWARDVARLPIVRVEGDRVTIRDVRDFAWTGPDDARPAWRDMTFDLDQLREVDLFTSDWGAAGIVHTIMSWGFADGQRLAISIETRKEVGAGYSALLGFFRQFELIVVAATERDVIGVRAAYRGERVRRWPLRVPPERARVLLETYLAAMRDLERRPRWYNALTVNCTTAIVRLVHAAGGSLPWDWRIVVNARIDELLAERGLIDPGSSREARLAAAEVTERARAALTAPDFSAALRSGPDG